MALSAVFSAPRVRSLSMAGRIKSSDIDEVKQRVNIAEIVSEHVALKTAGIDSMKGLCPFHDERTPSFHVRPNLGYFHCFGCGESGDVLTFIQRIDHLSFTEAVERLAAKIGYALTYEDGPSHRDTGPRKSRLYAANQAAEVYFQEQLETASAAPGRDLLETRGFDESARKHFGVGYSHDSWDDLTAALRQQGFTDEEIIQAGLASVGNQGLYDRFRGRLMWPIRDTSGQTVGFGARRLREDDNGPKYLNTPETPIYHKSQVLYGLDLAKRAISRNRRAIVVEGYTDVMACHMAGITEAVATCGTAFGKDHISLLRRIMGDDTSAEVIFTFDPDEAGQKAALKAFSEERRFSAQTFIAVAPDGLDPSDLRQFRGNEAVRMMFETKTPLVEFALRQAIGKFNVNTVEGRTGALRAAAPIIADIKDPMLKPAYTRELARMLGLELPEVQYAVREQTNALRRSETGRSSVHAAGQLHYEERPSTLSLSTLPNTAGTRLERDSIAAMLQYPQYVGADLFSQVMTAEIHNEALKTVRDAIAPVLSEIGTSNWIEQVIESVPERFRMIARELAFFPLPQRNENLLPSYVRGVVASLLERDLLALKAEMVARLNRIGEPSDPQYRSVQEQIVMLEKARRALQEN